MNEKSNTIQPKFSFALLTMLFIIGILMTGLLHFEADMHLLLIICLIVAVLASLKIGFSWDELQESMVKSISRAMQALFFFFLIGMAVAAWIQSGTVPALIYYGLNILTPTFFLPAGLIIASIASVATGSSWTAAGTIGIALMGVGVGMGIPAPLVAGMIISGAYFGDKMSPLSETTNLAPAIAGSDLYKHIGAMLYTTIPAYIISLIIYTVMGFKYAGATIDSSIIADIQTTILSNFDIGIIVLLPIVVVLILSIMKFSAIPGLTIGIALSIPISMFIQGVSFVDILSTLNYGYSIESGVEIVDSLFNKGGIQSMMWTFSLAIIALSLGGILTKSKILVVIIDRILTKVTSIRALPGLTVITAILVNATMGEQYMGIVVTGELYGYAYEKKGLQKRMLSRCMEEGGTLTACLFPWTTGGAFMFTALGVSNFAFAPYAFLNLINPLLGILLPLFGLTLLTTNKEKK